MPDPIETKLTETLERYLKGESNEPRVPPHLADSIRYSLLAPGKRIRPRLALACARLDRARCPSRVTGGDRPRDDPLFYADPR